MEPNEKMLQRMSSGIEYRKVNVTALELRSEDDNDMVVEGYATTFNEPYELYSWDDYRVREQVSPDAFNECDMSDVIFQYNHEGRVFARTRNKTLELECDEHGLKIRAHLGGTETGRQLYEEIKGGYTDRMSFGFVVKSDERLVTTIDGMTDVLRTITGIEKLYDVSAVSIPANDATEISARSCFDGIVEAVKEQEALERENNHKAELRMEILKLLGREEH